MRSRLIHDPIQRPQWNTGNGNRYLLRDILRKQWKYTGIVVSDWGAIGEMINHGFVADGKKPQKRHWMLAATSIWRNRSYKNHLAELARNKKNKNRADR